MQSDSSLESHHGTEHLHKKKRCRVDSETCSRKRRRLLPSPSTSSPPLLEKYRILQPNLQDLRKRPQSAPGSTVAEFGSTLNIEHPAHHTGGQRSGPDAEEVPSTAQEKRQTAKAIDASSVLGPEGTDCEEKDTEAYTPISFWAQTGRWPENFSAMSRAPSNSPKKRPFNSSYTQSYKDGAVPKAYSAAHENVFPDHGLFMDELKGRRAVHEDSKVLCTNLLGSVHAEPQYTTFPLEQFLEVWQRAQTRNEAKLYRDLTPLLVPSPELLWICGHDKLEHLVDEIDVEWTKCKTLGAPRPKPDLAVGIAPSAFSEEEMAKLQNHRSFERPTMFTDNMLFPFLLCEVKCTNEGIDQADRQNMHSSSIAVNAILQLYRAVDESKAIELSGQILVFSVSHNNKQVNLYGHLAVVEGEKAYFYRYPIRSFLLNFAEDQGRKRTHDFVREIYDTFYPAHLKRIRDALAAMKAPQPLSMSAHMSLEEAAVANSQEQNAGFTVPGTPASKRRKDEVAGLQQQLDQRRERETALQKQIEDLVTQLEQQRKDAEQQRKDAEQQRKDAEQQRKEVAEQQKELMEALKRQEDQITQQSEQISQLLRKG